MMKTNINDNSSNNPTINNTSTREIVNKPKDDYEQTVEKWIADADNFNDDSSLKDMNQNHEVCNASEKEIAQWFANANNSHDANVSKPKYLDLEKIANGYYKKKDFISAAEFYKKAINELDNEFIYAPSKYAAIYARLGACYYYLERYGEAERITMKAIEVSPDKFANFYNNLGMVQVELAETKTSNKDKYEKYLSAIDNFQQALKINSQDKIACQNLSKIYSMISETHQKLAKYFDQLRNDYLENKQFEPAFQCLLRVTYHNSESKRCCSEAAECFKQQLPGTTSFTKIIQALGLRANKKRKGAEVNNNEADGSKRECLKKLRM